MQISFQRTFAQFSEDYLATHYSGGVSSLGRLAGGPLLIVIGTLIANASRAQFESAFALTLAFAISISFILWGAIQTLKPLFNLFLVWLRREAMFSGENAKVEMEITGEILKITEGKENIELPIDQIKSIQHRSQSTWILTEGDYLIAIPREGIRRGNHEDFISALEEIKYPDEEG